MVNKEKLCSVLFCAYWEKEGKAFYKENRKKKERKKNLHVPETGCKEERKKKREKAKLSKEKKKKNKSGIVYIVYVEVA